MILNREGRTIPASGPMLTPFIGNDMSELFMLAPVSGQPFPPVPIIVIGHFDDERAADCRVEAKHIWANRFVLDRIVEFEPSAVPTPAITPTPTPFPFDSPPTPASRRRGASQTDRPNLRTVSSAGSRVRT